MRLLFLLAIALGVLSVATMGACGEPFPGGLADAAWLNGDGTPYCWIYDCPLDPAATECGTCVEGHDRECPPGFVCSCSLVCIKGPRSYDARPACTPDAALDAPPGTPDAAPRPDAYEYEWPVCDEHHMPGT